MQFKKNKKTGMQKNILHIILLFVAIISLFSCAPSRQAYYFHELEPSTQKIDSIVIASMQKIQIGDRLSIIISTKDQAQNELFNPLGLARGGGGNNTFVGYLVNKEGFIELPVLGNIKVLGSTTQDVAAVVKEKLTYNYKEPFVNVNLLGRVVVLGTRSPGVVPLYNERLTIFEAIAQSGEMEPAARRDRVWVIREENGERTSALVNINSPEIFNSPYYYLRTNDLVYVEPNRVGSFLGVNAPARNLFVTIISIAALVVAIVR